MSGDRSHPGYPPLLKNVGEAITSLTPQITSPVHHVTTTNALTTLTPPFPDDEFVGPLYLIADSVFDWTTSGNIAAAPGTTLVAGRAYGFVYDQAVGSWYPFGEDS